MRLMFQVYWRPGGEGNETVLIAMHLITAEVDACVEPVLEMDEANNHPHNK